MRDKVDGNITQIIQSARNHHASMFIGQNKLLFISSLVKLHRPPMSAVICVQSPVILLANEMEKN